MRFSHKLQINQDSFWTFRLGFYLINWQSCCKKFKNNRLQTLKLQIIQDDHVSFTQIRGWQTLKILFQLIEYINLLKKKLVSSLKNNLLPKFFCLKNFFLNIFFKAHKKRYFFDLQTLIQIHAVNSIKNINPAKNVILL